MEKKMFIKASPLIFANAKRLRNNMTDAEIILWQCLKTKPLGYKFRRQHPIHQSIADFYCHALQLIIEVDGGIHEKEKNKSADEERDKQFKSIGIVTLRYTNTQIFHSLETVLINIENNIIQLQKKFSLQGVRGYESNC
jgi:cyclase